MGRKRSAKGQMGAGTTAPTDNEILERAIADNQAAKAKALEKAPSRAELLTELDKIVVFNIVAVIGNGPKSEPVTDPSGCWVWYLDARDAIEEMDARKITHPGHLVLSCTPLGRAFGLVEGWVTPHWSGPGKLPPMRLQASQEELQATGDLAKQLCPPAIREKMSEFNGPLPLYSLQEWQDSSTSVPWFFSKGDLVEHVVSTGKPADQLEGLMLTDLRVLVVSMLTNPADWARLKLRIASTSTECLKWMKASSEENAKAAHTQAQVAHAPAATAADEPPALEEEPPPLA